MIDLKLFSKLQKGDTAFLLLSPDDPGKLRYYLMSVSVNYSIVAAGECEGELPRDELVGFDVSLSSIIPLLDKGKQFTVSFDGEILRFNDVNGRYNIEPLCVQNDSQLSKDVAKKYTTFIEAYNNYVSSASEEEEISQRLVAQEYEYQQARIMSLSGGASSDPFTDIDPVKAVEERYIPKLQQTRDRLSTIRDRMQGIAEIDLHAFKNLATVASKFNQIVSMCGQYSIVSLATCYVLQKAESPILAMQGKLLRHLLLDTKGKFYSWGEEIVFCTNTVGKKGNKETTVVFLSRYLPSVAVDDTIITRGAVEEQYVFKLKPLMDVVLPCLGKFSDMSFDMGNSRVELRNDQGEKLTYDFELESQDSIYVRKARRGLIDVSEITIATVNIPREVQTILYLFGDKLTMHVKRNKVVLQSDSLYVVFGR